MVPWVISARSAEALTAQAGRLMAHVQANPGLDPIDVGCSLASRSVFEHRAVVVGASREQLIAGLAGLAAGEPGAGVAVGQPGSVGKTVVVFPGQGAQRIGMGRELYGELPVFAQAFDAVADELDRHLRLPLRDVIWGADADLLDSTEFAQPALFAVEVASFAVLRDWGVLPDFVMGHSVGELAAAHAAGVLTLADAAMLVVARGRLMQALPAGGAMVAVAASEDEVEPLLGEGVGIAAINAPESVVISGAQAAANAIADRFAAQGRRVHQLAVSHAFHSPLMEPMLEEFARVAARVQAREPQLGLVSNVTGELAGPDFGSAQYWVDHVRRPVRFADSARHLQTLGATHFIEAGPGSGLTGSIEQSLAPADAMVVSMLGKDRPELASALGAAGQVFTTGVPVQWSAVFAGSGGRRVQLPTYAFQRRRFWETPGADGPADAAGLGLGATEHALLGAVVERPDSDEVVLTGRLSLADQPWLADHVVNGVVLFPGAGFVELVIRAGDEVGCALIEELVLAAPLVMHPGVGVQVQVVVGAADESGHRAVSVYSRGDQSQGWLLNAEGMLGVAAAETPMDLSVWPPRRGECGYLGRLCAVGRARLCLRPRVSGSGGDLAAGVGAVRRSCSPRRGRRGRRPNGDASGGVGRGAACPRAGRREDPGEHRDETAVLLAWGVAACRRRWTGAGPLRVRGRGCDFRGRLRRHWAAGVDGALAGYSPDNRRTAARRRDRGRRCVRSGAAGSGVVADLGGQRRR